MQAPSVFEPCFDNVVPPWTKGSALLDLRAVADEPPDQQPTGAFVRQRLLAAHGTCLLSLVFSDVLVYRWRGRAQGLEPLGILLVVLYVFLALWLAVHCCLHTAMAKHALGAGAVTRASWMVVAVLQTGAAFVSAFWREPERPQRSEFTARTLCITGVLQLTVATIYDAGSGMLVLLTLACMAVLCGLEASQGTPLVSMIDDALLFAAVAVACMLAASRRQRTECVVPLEPSPQGAIASFLRPLAERRGGGVEQLRRQLAEATDAALGATTLQRETRELFATVFHRISDELGDDPPDEHFGDLSEASPMTLQYVSQTLNVREASVLPASTPGTPSDSRSCLSIPPAKAESGREAELPQDLAAVWEGASERRTATKEERRGTFQVLSKARGQTWLPPSVASGSEAPTAEAWEQVVAEMVQPLSACQVRAGPPPPKTDDLAPFTQRLGEWALDVFRLNGLCGGRALVSLGSLALTPVAQSLLLKEDTLQHFLDGVESRYSSDVPYHNLMHGADVLNNMVYFLQLQSRAFAKLEHVEELSALAAACAHDVGHSGRSNAFQVSACTSLACLYNDQSPLENMHCAITFALLRMPSCDFLQPLPSQLRAVFRSSVTHMILATDLAKHCQSLSHFRKEFCAKGACHAEELTALQRKELLAFTLKCCDVGHSTKPFELHMAWTLRINEEFFAQGDLEMELGLPCSPFCGRSTTHISESQRGFYTFVVTPMYKAMDEFLDNRRLGIEVLGELQRNSSFWEGYDGSDFNYADPTSNVELLRGHFRVGVQCSIEAGGGSFASEGVRNKGRSSVPALLESAKPMRVLTFSVCEGAGRRV